MQKFQRLVIGSTKNTARNNMEKKMKDNICFAKTKNVTQKNI